MELIEKAGNVFLAPDNYYLAHCISADYALGKGIAKEFDVVYNMRKRLNEMYPRTVDRVGTALLVDDVFNLVTKKFFFQKPTLETLEAALVDMKNQCIELGIKKIAMPRIGCGLDRLTWKSENACVYKVIEKVFEDTDTEIVVYTLEQKEKSI